MPFNSDAVNNTHSIQKDKDEIITKQKHDASSISNGTTHFSKNLSLNKRFGTFPKKSQNITSILMGGGGGGGSK